MTVTTKIGFGPKAVGQIMVTDRLDNAAGGKIVVSLDFVGREFLEKAGLVGVAGLVVPAVHWRDFEHAKNLAEFPLLVLLKFGRLDLQKDLAEKMTKFEGKKGVLNGEEKTLVV